MWGKLSQDDGRISRPLGWLNEMRNPMTSCHQDFEMILVGRDIQFIEWFFDVHGWRMFEMWRLRHVFFCNLRLQTHQFSVVCTGCNRRYRRTMSGPTCGINVVSPMSGGALLGVCRGRSVWKFPPHFTEWLSSQVMEVEAKSQEHEGLDCDFKKWLTSILAFLMISWWSSLLLFAHNDPCLLPCRTNYINF